MAENKKSFLIYSDTINNISHLTNEEKGILFQHLLEYVNDLNPVLEDRLILTAWKPIETHLKRDLKKWDSNAQQRSDKARKAGLASAKARELKATKSNSVVENQLEPTKSTVNVNVSVSEIIDKSITYGKEDFLNDWNSLRKEHLGKPSFLNTIDRDSEDNFKQLLNNYQKEDFKYALIGLFKQKKLPNGMTTMQSNPKHFLKTFESYLTAYHDKNTELYGKQENG